MKQCKRNAKKAFTITELVIVIAVIAILAAVLIPTFTYVVNKARESAAMQACKNVSTQVLSYELEKSGDIEGYCFVSGDYTYQFKNGQLQQVNAVAAVYDKTATYTAVEGFELGDVKVYAPANLTITLTAGESGTLNLIVPEGITVTLEATGEVTLTLMPAEVSEAGVTTVTVTATQAGTTEITATVGDAGDAAVTWNVTVEEATP